MHKIKSQTAPNIFQNNFRKPTHEYPTNFSTSNYSIPPSKLKKPKLWINIPTNSEKIQESVTVFKNSMRNKLQELENETSYI